MKRRLLLGWVCLFGVLLFAQEDPVLMRVNNKEVLRSEFEKEYRNYSANAEVMIAPKEYAELFVNRKLKIEAAKMMRIDTLSSLRMRQKDFRTSLLNTYLMDERIADSCARACYNKMRVVAKYTEQVQVMQVFKKLPQVISNRHLEAERIRMDSIYREISNSSSMEFMHWVSLLSDDKQCMWIEPLQVTSEFENIAFALSKDEVSKPFFTPVGIHILKVVDRKEMPGYEAVGNQLSERAKRGWGLDKGTEAVVEQLKSRHQYTANRIGMEQLMLNGETELPLFTIGKESYTGTLFKRFASSCPQSLKRQLNGFIAKSILDYESNHIETSRPDVQCALRHYEEEMLVSQLTYLKVDSSANNDRVALATYFKFHQADYRWESPRYRGVVLHCSDKKVAKQAKKLLRKLSEKEWADTLRKTFNTSEVEAVKVEQGIFADGDNKYIDKLVFKKGDFEPLLSHPFTIVAGKKMKGPDNYREVIEQVRKHYRNYLDACWTRELRASGKVEINQEVLKTVNNS